MIGAIGLLGVSLGAALAHVAGRIPARTELLEGGGGALLIAGLALIGSGLPFIP